MVRLVPAKVVVRRWEEDWDWRVGSPGNSNVVRAINFGPVWRQDRLLRAFRAQMAPEKFGGGDGELGPNLWDTNTPPSPPQQSRWPHVAPGLQRISLDGCSGGL